MTQPALHGEIQPFLCTLARMAEAAKELGGEFILSRHLGWANWSDGLALRRCIKKWAPGVYSVPVLNGPACANLVNAGDVWGYDPNVDEEPEFQIPEIVLAHKHPPTHAECMAVWEMVLAPLFQILYRLEPEEVTSIQLTRYTPENTSKGNWHRDEDSDCTAVINLGSRHTGGGTKLFVDGRPLFVPPLPTGHALLFLGRSTLHCGAEITEGQRDLLVFWSKL